jgi:hypothetical protein
MAGVQLAWTLIASCAECGAVLLARRFEAPAHGGVMNVATIKPADHHCRSRSLFSIDVAIRIPERSPAPPSNPQTDLESTP